MTQIATRWVDKNIDVISKRMKTKSRQGLRINFDNNIINSIKTNGVSEFDDSSVDEPIVEFCTINSSGPKTDQSLKLKVHLSKIASKNIVVDFKFLAHQEQKTFHMVKECLA